MTGMAIPRRLSLDTTNVEICKRIGVKFNGVDCGKTVNSYDLDTNEVTFTMRFGDYWPNQVYRGVIEPYIRAVTSAGRVAVTKFYSSKKRRLSSV